MTGNITRRGKASWRVKYEGGERDPLTGGRQTRYATVRGTKKDAQRELTRLLAAVDAGTAVAPAPTTIAEYLRGWLDTDNSLAPKTLERYRELAERQIIPHLGAKPLQKLRPAEVDAWHGLLLRAGGKDGKPLAARTVGHAHRLLHRGLARAVALELIARNVAHAAPPPKPEAAEVAILTADQIVDVLDRLADHRLYPIAALALGTGMRRGELCALAWGALDLDGAAAVRVERSLEDTAAGLRFKPPKTRYGRRTLSLPAAVVDIMRAHRRRQAEFRLALGAGRPSDDDLVFTLPDGSPYPPRKLSWDWSHLVRDHDLPHVMFHALRHSHASALIAAGLDVVTVSRRLGHGSPAITLSVYAHQFAAKDAEAAAAIDAVLGAKSSA